jgi:hypothetical protein
VVGTGEETKSQGSSDRGYYRLGHESLATTQNTSNQTEKQLEAMKLPF